MFTPVGPASTTITVHLDGKPIPARLGESIAACLLRAGVRAFRATPVSGSPRGPFCMIGHCFDCLIEVEGSGSRQACLVQVAEGMRLRTQQGPAAVRPHGT